MPKRTGAAVCRQHGVLQRVLGILGGAAGEPGKPVQLPVMTVEQLVEGVAFAGDVGGQQLGIAAFPLDLPPNPRPDSNQSVVARHFTPIGP